jgi:hypothetical protein
LRFSKHEAFDGVRPPACELISRALHKAEAIGAALAIILDAAKMRLDDGGALRLS